MIAHINRISLKAFHCNVNYVLYYDENDQTMLIPSIVQHIIAMGNFRQAVHMARACKTNFCVSHGRFLSGCMSQYPTTAENSNPRTRNQKSYDSIIRKHKIITKAHKLER